MSVIQFKEANCKNCYKCIRSCPVKAIAFSGEQARIVEEDCTLCGRCLLVCPQNAKSVSSDVEKVKDFIQRREKVYVSLAPSFVAAFPEPDERKILAAIKRLGFTHIEETVIGAVQVSREYGRLMRERKMPNIISTCCPSVISLVEKYYPELVDQLAPVVSPMIAHAKMMRELYGSRIRVVFIGPCISKKEECRDLQNEGAVDAVMTFEELEKWLEAEGIGFDDLSEEELKGVRNYTARYYPAPGGIIKTLGGEEKRCYKCISLDGIDRCKSILDSIKEGNVSNYFLEMSSCDGGCLGGPCIKPDKGSLDARDRLLAYVKRAVRDNPTAGGRDTRVDMTKKFVDRSRQYVIPDEETLRGILSQIGKNNKEKELNCGACGYPSCRDKAIAVYNKKAELHMCLPYMRERAESVSNIIIQATPNGLIALDMELSIQEVNAAAQQLFGIDPSDAKGKNIFEYLDCPDIAVAKETGQSIKGRKYHYSQYGLTVEQSVIVQPEQHLFLLVIRDITAEEKQQQQLYKVRSETVDIAQRVIEKQMRVAQEIASLLGETTAETKVILTQLKKSILSEIGEDR